MKIITFDIETTGQHSHAHDVIVAIGACVGELQDNGAFNVLSKHSWARDMRKPADTDWASFWILSGFEPRCYQEFWSKYEDILDGLQRDATIQSDAVLARKLNYFLEDQEKDGPFCLLFDTLLFDSVWLDNLLRSNGYAGLSRNRDGSGWRSAFELDSFRFGATGAPLGNWGELTKRCNAHPTVFPENGERIAHHPRDDALGIFIDLARVINAK